MNDRLLLPDPFFIDFKIFHDVWKMVGLSERFRI